MPYESLAQERYFNANKSKLQKQGVNVNEWNKASKGRKLPMEVSKHHEAIAKLHEKLADNHHEMAKHEGKEEKGKKPDGRGFHKKLESAADKTFNKSNYR